jgi:hypothetical protein
MLSVCGGPQVPEASTRACCLHWGWCALYASSVLKLSYNITDTAAPAGSATPMCSNIQLTNSHLFCPTGNQRTALPSPAGALVHATATDSLTSCLAHQEQQCLDRCTPSRACLHTSIPSLKRAVHFENPRYTAAPLTSHQAHPKRQCL